MRSAEDLQRKPIEDRAVYETTHEEDSLGECTSCSNEDVLYFLNEEDQVCYDCYHKFYKEGGKVEKENAHN